MALDEIKNNEAIELVNNYLAEQENDKALSAVNNPPFIKR